MIDTATFQLADWINAPGAAEPRFIEGDGREVVAGMLGMDDQAEASGD